MKRELTQKGHIKSNVCGFSFDWRSKWVKEKKLNYLMAYTDKNVLVYMKKLKIKGFDIQITKKIEDIAIS